MRKIMKTEFKGNPFIEIPKTILGYDFLTGDFGEEFLREYNGIVKSDYKDNSNLRVLNFESGVVKGSNTYSIFLANKILSQEGLRTANPVDVQKIIDKDEDFLRGHYLDLGVVLRTEDRISGYLAKQLGESVKELGHKFSDENPLVFKSSDLELILDDNSSSGLGLKIKDSADLFNAPELAYKNNDKRFNKTNERGMPVFVEDGDRVNCTRKRGLSRFDLCRGSDLNSWGGGLAGSGSIGRVVVLDA